MCKNSFRTSQEAHYISTTKSNWLMLFKETISVVKLLMKVVRVVTTGL
jgi:hypothetical protein